MRSLAVVCVCVCCLLTFLSNGYGQIGPDTTFCAGSTALGSAPDPQHLYHLYGTRPGELNIGNEFAAFANTFDLYVMDGVVSRWSPDSVRVFCGKILDDNPNNSYDICPRIWAYFCYVDNDPSYDGISVSVGTGAPLTKISIYLYDIANIDCQQGGYDYECAADDGAGCYGHSYVAGYLGVVVNASATFRKYGVGCAPRTVDNVARHGLAHEMQHAMFRVNLFWGAYNSVDESLSTLSEWISRAMQDKGVDVPYDSSVFRGEKCDAASKYYVEQPWMAYLYEAYDGGNGDITDDLVYRWIRKEINGHHRMTMHSLAEVLAEPDFEWIGGATGDERLALVFQAYAVAKYANAPNASADGRFGYRNYDPQREVAMFKDECTSYWGLRQDPVVTPVPPDLDCYGQPVPDPQKGCWNVRVLPPEFILDGAVENDRRLVTGTYTLDIPGSPAFDGSTDYIDVPLYGTDYIVFRADDYFQDVADHEFHCSLRQVSPAPSSDYRVKVWAIGYDTATGDLTQQPEHITFVQSLNVVNNNASVVVTGFGASIKSVVLVVTLVEAEARDISGPAIGVSDPYYFSYEYEFGVDTPGVGVALEWAGDAYVVRDYQVPANASLTLHPGTNVHVWTDDLADLGYIDHVEFRVYGSVAAIGTSEHPIAFSAVDMNGPSTNDDDWWGIYVQSGGEGTFEHCIVRNGRYGIQANAPISLVGCLIEDTSHIGVSVAGAGTVSIDSTIIRGPDYGVNALLGTQLTLDHSTIEDCPLYGAAVYKDSSVKARSTTFNNNDTGLYLAKGIESWVKAIVRDCSFNDNVDGISIISTGDSTVSVRGCAIDGSATSGIYVWGSGNVSILDNTISYGQVGVFSDTLSTTEIRSGNVIQHNGTGVRCAHGAYAAVESCTVNYNLYGFGVFDGAGVDLGTYSGGNSSGYNVIKPNTTYHIMNYTETTVMAQQNYWPQKLTEPLDCNPKSTHLYGPVEYSFPLCDQPALTSLAYQPIPGDASNEVPRSFGLEQNYPNPFNPSTTVTYEVPTRSNVELAIYDVAGRLVAVLVDEERSAGRYTAHWNGRDRSGQSVASGMYFVRMRAGSFIETKKLLLIK